MYVYHYRPDTLEYIGPSLADESPLEPGVFLIPADATDIAPPQPAEGNSIVFNGTGWGYVHADLPEMPPSDVPVELTPEQVRAKMPGLSPRQVRLALLSIGITEGMVDDGLSSDPAGLIEWKYATMFSRVHPLVDLLATEFELPAAQVDDLWNWASGL